MTISYFWNEWAMDTCGPIIILCTRRTKSYCKHRLPAFAQTPVLAVAGKAVNSKVDSDEVRYSIMYVTSRECTI